ncbi:hypothetical protein QR680_001204 [Steinernema hermaphroditum]|uniref:Folliculin n=1 Tax=Steinernema hermaphroditum TaxID=289476 RepID=A0AA39LFL7_9BILA|nr:hypothetical protein QR680_001204 [Steinernema hermaphroditum]
MHAVVALCHFCESHGPRIVYVCQPISKISQVIANDDGARSPKTSTNRRQANTNAKKPTISTMTKEYRGCLADDSVRCSACSSFGRGPGLITNDYQADMSYVSTQSAVDDGADMLIQQACWRSLTCEIASVSRTENPRKEGKPILEIERSGTVFFGDAENGYTISYVFRLPDARARGFARLYSLIVVCLDKLLLLTYYDFFVNGFSAISDSLVEQSQQIFLREQKAEEEDALRLATAQRASMLPQGFLRHRNGVTVDTSRSLGVITGNHDVFNSLHRRIMWLLRTQTMLREEMCMEGLPTQDMLVFMEMDHDNRVEMDLLGNDRTSASTSSQLSNLKWIVQEVGADLDALLYQIITGGQVVVRSNDKTISKSLLLALTHLLPMGCIRFLSSSNIYYHPVKYNFLGVTLNTTVPRDLENQPVVLHVTSLFDQCEAVKLTDCKLTVECVPSLPRRLPALLNRFRQLLKEYSLSSGVLEATLRATREEWLSKAKLVYQVSRQKEQIDINAVIKIIKCGEHDRLVLRFWQSGLSKVYKQQVIDTINKS